MIKRVLICDDAAFMRIVLKRIMLQGGYEVCGEATNGDDAIRKYKDLKPDLVTLDVTMPKKDGLTALREIMDYDKDAKVIMCSAMGQQPIIIDAIKTGAKDFIIKPFNKDRVLHTVGNL